MRPEILGIFIPIIFLIGLFTVIALNIYFKYKTRTATAERMPGESLGEWYKAEAKAKIVTGRAAALRTGGFLVGAGIGTGIGCTLLAAGAISHNDRFDEVAIATFLIIALAIFFGGAGMVGASFLERKLDEKRKPE